MTWTYDRARFYGTKTSPKTGDYVEVRLVNNDSSGESDYHTLKWGFDKADGLSSVQFRNMVKAEVKAHLKHLNRQPVEHIVDNDFDPK